MTQSAVGSPGMSDQDAPIILFPITLTNALGRLTSLIQKSARKAAAAEDPGSALAWLKVFEDSLSQAYRIPESILLESLADSDIDDEPVIASDLLTRLRAYRDKCADERRVAVSNVMSDAAIRDIVRTRPKTIEQLSLVQGIGPKRLEAYGDGILEVVDGGEDDPA